MSPKSLYDLSLGAVVKHVSTKSAESVMKLPNIIFTLIYFDHRKIPLIYTDPDFNELFKNIYTWKLFSRLLKCVGSDATREKQLHRAFQHRAYRREYEASNLVRDFQRHCESFRVQGAKDCLETLELGSQLGVFLAEAGLYDAAEKAFHSCEALATHAEKTSDDPLPLTLFRGCNFARLMHALNSDEKYVESVETYYKAQRALESVEKELKDPGDERKTIRTPLRLGFAEMYAHQSALLIGVGEYTAANVQAELALSYLENDDDHKITSIVLHQVARAALHDHTIGKAYYWIKTVVKRARGWYGVNHPVTAEALSLLSIFFRYIGHRDKAIDLGEKAAQLMWRFFRGDNVRVAQIHENLAAPPNYWFQIVKVPYYRHFVAAERIHSMDRYYRLICKGNLAKNASAKAVETALMKNFERLKQARMAFGEDSSLVSMYYAFSGNLNLAMGRDQDAETTYLKAIEIRQKVCNDKDLVMATIANRVAGLIGKKCQPPNGLFANRPEKQIEAIQLARASLAIQKRRFSIGSMLLAEANLEVLSHIKPIGEMYAILSYYYPDALNFRTKSERLMLAFEERKERWFRNSLLMDRFPCDCGGRDFENNIRCICPKGKNFSVEEMKKGWYDQLRRGLLVG